MKGSKRSVLEWIVGAVVLILVLALFYVLTTPAHAAEETSKSSTGIPIEWLFGIVTGLVALIYGDIKRDLRSLSAAGKRRTGYIRHVESHVRKICNKLHIEYEEDDDNE